MQNSAAKRIAELRETCKSSRVCIVRPSVLFFVPRVRISGRSRVEFQNFARKIARNPTAKLRNFGCRRCAQDARKARRLIQTASDAVPCTPALSGTVLKALGACRAAKLCRRSSNHSRFQPKITVFECKVLRQKSIAKLRTSCASCASCVKRSSVSSLRLCACINGRNGADNR